MWVKDQLKQISSYPITQGRVQMRFQKESLRESKGKIYLDCGSRNNTVIPAGLHIKLFISTSWLERMNSSLQPAEKKVFTVPPEKAHFHITQASLC